MLTGVLMWVMQCVPSPQPRAQPKSHSLMTGGLSLLSSTLSRLRSLSATHLQSQPLALDPALDPTLDPALDPALDQSSPSALTTPLQPTTRQQNVLVMF